MKFFEQLVEDAIVGMVISALVDEGYQVHVSNQDGGGGTWIYASEDGKRPKGGWVKWVKLMPGNGLDVIVDYTTNLETVLAPINKFVEKLETLTLG